MSPSTHPFADRLRGVDTILRLGRVRSILPTHIEADGPAVPLGALCQIETRGDAQLLAEVVQVASRSITLVPLGDARNTFSGATVSATSEGQGVPVGRALHGRAVNAMGLPLDDRPLFASERHPLHGVPPNALTRASIQERLHTGIRAIDGLLPLHRGQRIGVFAASGVGKTSLINLLSENVAVDRCIICLVGERGSEVEALWNGGLSPAARARTTLVAATSDESAPMRVRACHYALALAEYGRSKGQHVLLIMDSVTRLAMAMREIGLAAGEPPTVRAYTPGVFAAIPKIVERCGAIRGGGSISAVMTVLSETDDVDDPVSEMMKSLLDGHIILSRELADQGHFPAIDVLRSISRRAEAVMTAEHKDKADAARALLAAYANARTLIEAGLYTARSNDEIDEAIAARPQIMHFLRQSNSGASSFSDTQTMLAKAVGQRAT